MNKLASRKFITTVLTVLSAAVLVWFKRIDAGVHACVVVAAVGGYLAANVLEARP